MFEYAYIKIQKLAKDMIQIYNTVSGEYNTHSTVEFNLSHVSNTTGNNNINMCSMEIKLVCKKLKYDAITRCGAYAVIRLTV